MLYINFIHLHFIMISFPACFGPSDVIHSSILLSSCDHILSVQYCKLVSIKEVFFIKKHFKSFVRLLFNITALWFIFSAFIPTTPTPLFALLHLYSSYLYLSVPSLHRNKVLLLLARRWRERRKVGDFVPERAGPSHR